MGNIFDYLAWRGDLDVRSDPFNAVDSLILTVLSYLPFDGIVPSEFGKHEITIRETAKVFLRQDIKGISIRDTKDCDLLSSLASSIRFGTMGLSGYVSQTDAAREKQFSAITVTIGDGTHFIAYRGTDLSLVGWKEDFNMSFMTTVPAQTDAVEYLERACSRLRGKLRIGGHSKGGNLAVYAASFCDNRTRKHILSIFNGDGPGFDASVLQSKGYKAASDRVNSFIPQSSVIGMMLESEKHASVIESSQTGILQHDPYSWTVCGKDFTRVESIDGRSRFYDRTISEWLAALSRDEREKFVEALFAILSATGAKTFTEMTADRFTNAKIILKTLKSIDDPTKKILQQTLALLVQSAKRNFGELKAKQ
jgi:hypothetical protein